MRFAIVGAIVLVAGFACTAPQPVRVVYHPWCLYNSQSGTVYCPFDSYAQCMESAGGIGSCIENAARRPAADATLDGPAGPTVPVAGPGNRALGADPDPAVRAALQREVPSGTASH
jgi:uncharacterized protein DUF3551